MLREGSVRKHERQSLRRASCLVFGGEKPPRAVSPYKPCDSAARIRRPIACSGKLHLPQTERSPKFWTYSSSLVPHHIHSPLNPRRSTGFGAVVLLVGGLWLNPWEMVWRCHIFCVIFHLFHGFVWSLILRGVIIKVHVLSSTRWSKDIHRKSCDSSLCWIRPLFYPSSIHIPHEEIMWWCWSTALKPPPFLDKWMNSDFHRFLAFLQGPVWLKSIVLQPGEGPFYPKMCSNLDSANGQSVVGAIQLDVWVRGPPPQWVPHWRMSW